MLVFEKIHSNFDGDPNDAPDEVESISLSGPGAQQQTPVWVDTTHYINDGGDDMYDSGNILSTDLSDVPISYTHVRNDTAAHSTSIEDGSTWFGSGSEYFTNFYDGLFVLAAHDILGVNIFGTDGGLGADGSGIVAAGHFSLTVSSQQFTVFYKKVYDASDPSVNHLIIVPGDGEDMMNDYSLNSDNDYHHVIGIEGATKLYYLLFAGSGGYDVQQDEMENIATAFLNIVVPEADLTAALAALESDFVDVTDEMTHKYDISDDGGSTNSYIRYNEGIEDITGMVYIGKRADDNDNVVPTFLVSTEDGALFKVTSTGRVMRGGSIGLEINGMAFRNGVLYASSDFENLVIIDPITCELVSDKKGIFIHVNANAVGEKDGELYVTGYSNDNTAEVIFNIDSESLDANSTDITPTVWDITGDEEGYRGLAGVGTNPPEINEWFGSYNETQISISYPKNAKTPFVLENLEVQWNPAGYGEEPADEDWQDITPTQDENEEYYFVILDLPPTDITIRSRYNVSYDSEWVYSYID